MSRSAPRVSLPLLSGRAGVDRGVYVEVAEHAAAGGYTLAAFYDDGGIWYHGPARLRPADAVPALPPDPSMLEAWDAEGLAIRGGL